MPTGLKRILLALLLLGGCGRGEPPPRIPPSGPLSGPACVRYLAERGVAVQPWQGGTRACPIDTPVRTARGRLAGFAPPLETSCGMLVAWLDFEGDLVAIGRSTLGSPVVRVSQYGSFACRAMTGNSSRPSLHAQARALDLAGFTLVDGRAITVLKGWRGPAEQRRFLRAVAAAACRRFSVVLTPNGDRFHQDHIHVDIGPWRRCEA
ncbi:MAG: extensin family protein [Geminicoccaceae bacterium]